MFCLCKIKYKYELCPFEHKNRVLSYKIETVKKVFKKYSKYSRKKHEALQNINIKGMDLFLLIFHYYFFNFLAQRISPGHLINSAVQSSPNKVMFFCMLYKNYVYTIINLAKNTSITFL